MESTIERRAKLPGQEHVPAGLLRISVGCDHVEDLWADLAAALHDATSDATAAVATAAQAIAHPTALQDITAGSHP